jgi:hypothetical protein
MVWIGELQLLTRSALFAPIPLSTTPTFAA